MSTCLSSHNRFRFITSLPSLSITDLINSLDSHDWYQVMKQSPARETRFDILGNLPGELVQDICDYLDPVDIHCSKLVSCTPNHHTLIEALILNFRSLRLGRTFCQVKASALDNL
jgi:hypothetical protein